MRRGPTFRSGNGYIRVQRVDVWCWEWTVFARQRITMADGTWFFRIGAPVASGVTLFRWQAINQARIVCARLER
jgi:hypothetical protein